MAQNDKGKNKAILGVAGVLTLLAIKFQGVLFAGLKALSLFKISWLFSSVGSMLITLFLYVQVFGWKYAFALIILLYIHEMGHYVWATALGLKPQLPKFFFFVAWVTYRKSNDQAMDAWVSFAGPLIGAVGSAVMYWSGAHLDNKWLMAAGSTGFWLNLLQLIPAKPLDGGYVIAAVSRWLLIPGVALMFGLAFALQSGFMFIIGAISLFSLVAEFRKQRSTKETKPRAVVKTPTGAILTVRDLERAVQARQENPQPAGQQSVQSPVSEPVPEPVSAPAPDPQCSGNSAVVVDPDEEVKATPWQRVIIGVAYVTLVGILGYLYAMTASDMRELMRR